MDLYVIRRRSNWADADELETAAAKSTRRGREDERRRALDPQLRRRRRRTAGSARSASTRASSAEAIRQHADNTGMSADEITKVADTVIVREDPVAV